MALLCRSHYSGSVDTMGTLINATYVTAMVKGKPHQFCIKGGYTNSGTLKDRHYVGLISSFPR